jgi:hypothetical protein
VRGTTSFYRAAGQAVAGNAQRAVGFADSRPQWLVGDVGNPAQWSFPVVIAGRQPAVDKGPDEVRALLSVDGACETAVCRSRNTPECRRICSRNLTCRNDQVVANSGPGSPMPDDNSYRPLGKATDRQRGGILTED